MYTSFLFAVAHSHFKEDPPKWFISSSTKNGGVSYLDDLEAQLQRQLPLNERVSMYKVGACVWTSV